MQLASSKLSASRAIPQTPSLWTNSDQAFQVSGLVTEQPTIEQLSYAGPPSLNNLQTTNTYYKKSFSIVSLK